MHTIRRFRQRLYEVLERADKQDKLSRAYDYFIIILVILSAVPLMIKTWTEEIVLLDRAVTILFVIDYLLRWACADKMPWAKDRDKWQSFLLYPFTPMAIVDLLSILPVVTTFRLLPTMSLNNFVKVMRILRVFRCVRFFKTMRYSNSFVYLYRALKREAKLLSAVLILAAVYVFVSAAVVFSVEPDTFDNFFEALYWATVTLTTVGYGDLYPVTRVGRIISMISAVFGIAIVAMPAGLITSSFIEEVNRVMYRNERKLETEVAELLSEIRLLREEQAQRGLEDKIELIAEQVRQMQESNANDTVLLQDLSEDLKNALSYGTITEDKKNLT